MAALSWMRAVGGAGALLVAAERFLAREGIAIVPRGAEGLAWLARRIDAFAEREDVSAQDEGSFVEGAGAVLALLLLAHVGEGSHATRDGVHRVRLGARGFFDPFAAIESAIESDSARRALIEHVARAEREARGEEGVGLAASVFERVLAERRPDLEVVARFDRRLWLDGEIEIDLGRAIDASDGAAALERSIEKLIAMLPGGAGAAIARDEAIARLLPRLVAPAMLREAGPGLFARPTANDVAVALVLAYDGRSRFVRARELEGWSLRADDALGLAIANLAARSATARFARLDTEAGPMIVARTGDGLDSARLLLPTLPDVLAPELGDPFLAAVPHRDALIACAQGSAPLRAALAARAREDALRAPHRITDALFRVAQSGLAPA